MISPRGLAASACALFAVVACSDGTGPGSLPPTAECSAASLVSLAVGAYTIIDPSVKGSCIRVPAAGSAGAQYLYTALATKGVQTSAGVEDSYSLTGGAPSATMAVGGTQSNPLLAPVRASSLTPAAAFHHRLRLQELALAARAGGARFRAGAQPSMAAAVVPPQVGDARSFYVCANSTCDPSNGANFVQTTAHVKYVGQRVAIYLDDNAPAGGYTRSDLDQVGALFDEYLYPIDTTAFGREPDLDNNGVVAVLLTQKVNALSPNCTATRSVILGYFFGLDLTPGQQFSNDGEIFYGLVPDPANASCMIDTTYANRNLPPTFIHEFQHMISFNQHAVIRHSLQENVWLNEGLSHFAEELGGRKIPDARCINNSCINQFAADNLVNAYNYLADLEPTYLIAPSQSTGSLKERGAGWLFVRWLADHFGTDQYGTNVTRQLDNTTKVGADNVEAVTGQSFSTLVPLWQMANYLDNLPGFTPSSPLLQYSTWDLRDVYSSFHSDDPGDFPTAYPLIPDEVTTSAYSRSGFLRAGSGVHLLVTQPASGGMVDVRLTASDGTSLPPSTVTPRIALLRIR